MPTIEEPKESDMSRQMTSVEDSALSREWWDAHALSLAISGAIDRPGASARLDGRRSALAAGVQRGGAAAGAVAIVSK